MIAIVGRALAVIVAIVAMRVARRRPHHAPFAWWAVAAAVADPLACLVGWGLDGVAVPYSGSMRALHHAGQALYLIEPIGLATVAWTVLGLRRDSPLHGLGVGALILAAFVAG